MGFSETLKPICLSHWTKKQFNRNDRGVIAGWGQHRQGQSWASKLKETEAVIFTNPFCHEILKHQFSYHWHKLTRYGISLLKCFCTIYHRSNMCTGARYHDTGSEYKQGKFEYKGEFRSPDESIGSPCGGDKGTSLMVKENERYIIYRVSKKKWDLKRYDHNSSEIHQKGKKLVCFGKFSSYAAG